MSKHKDEYPEHHKLNLVKEQSQTIGEFIEWLEYHGYHICELDNSGRTDNYYLTTKRLPQGILAQYFDIDENKLEAEKRKMLDELRARHAESEANHKVKK